MVIIYSDQEIRQNVLDALSNDARIDASATRVGVTDATVHLDGTVPTYPEKIIAAEDAWRIKGVIDVVNNLKVQLTRTWTDQEMSDTIRRSLDHDSRITDPSKICVAVNHGVVTLSGIVPNYGQRIAAENDTWTAPGVVDATDNIVIAPPTERTDAEVAGEVRQALDQDPGINAANISVKVVDRKVYLDGSVPAVHQIGRASDDAWMVPGVADVVDELALFTPEPALLGGSLEPWTRWARLVSFLSVLVGVWLILSPFVLGYSQGTVPTTVSMITGSLVIVLAAIRYSIGDRAVWASWAIAVLGIWLLLAPFILDYLNNPVATTDHVVMGSIAFALGIASALATAPASTQQVSQ